MKAYQVYNGYDNSYGTQAYDLVATYLNKERAIQAAQEIVDTTELYGDTLKINDYENKLKNGTFKDWTATGWTTITIAEVREIEIIE